jgi:hypothetical protein
VFFIQGLSADNYLSNRRSITAATMDRRPGSRVAPGRFVADGRPGKVHDVAGEEEEGSGVRPVQGVSRVRSPGRAAAGRRAACRRPAGYAGGP